MKHALLSISLLFLTVCGLFGQQHPCFLHIDPSWEGTSNNGYKYYINMTITKADGTTVLFELDQDDEEKKKEINYFLSDYPKQIRCQAYKNHLETDRQYKILMTDEGLPYYYNGMWAEIYDEPTYMSDGKLQFRFASYSGNNVERTSVEFYLLPLFMNVKYPSDYISKGHLCPNDQLYFSWNLKNDGFENFIFDIYKNKYNKIVEANRNTHPVYAADLAKYYSTYEYNKELSITVKSKMYNSIDGSNVTLSFPFIIPIVYPDYPIDKVNPQIFDNRLSLTTYSLDRNDKISVFSYFEQDKNKNYDYKDITGGNRITLAAGAYHLTFYRGDTHCPVSRDVYIPKITYDYVGDTSQHNVFWHFRECREALALEFMFPSNWEFMEDNFDYNFKIPDYSDSEVVYDHSSFNKQKASISLLTGEPKTIDCWTNRYPIKVDRFFRRIDITSKDIRLLPIYLSSFDLQSYRNITASDSIVPPHCHYDEAELWIWNIKGGLETNKYVFQINELEKQLVEIQNVNDTIRIPIKDRTLDNITLQILDQKQYDDDTGLDKRHFTKENLTFYRPDTLKIFDSVSNNLRCHNDSSGSIEIKAVQRTYDDKELEYHWFKSPYTDELAFRGNKANHLPADSYRLVIFNDGCKDTSHYTITQPDTLLTSVTTVTNAMCYGYHDGAITTKTTGGTGQYTYSWSNGATTKDIDHLPIGRYFVTVTDEHGCEAYANDTITHPDELINSLTPRYTICKGGELLIDDGKENTTDFDGYEWHLPDSTKAPGRTIVITSDMLPGKYALVSKKDVPGEKDKYCFTTDTTLITFADNDLPVRFLVPTESFLGDTLVIAEDSEIDDYYTWHYAYNHDMFTDITKRMTADSTQTFLRIERFGNDTITMYAENGFCKASLSKAVTIHPESRPEDYDYTIASAGIFSRLQIGPNPNNGEFTLFANLTEDSELDVRLYDVSRSRRIPLDFSKYKTPSDRYQIPFQGLGLRTGIYTLLVSANGETKQIKFVVE